VTPWIAVDAGPAARAARTGTELFAWEVCRRLPDAAPDVRFTFYASRPGGGPGLDLTVLPFPRLWSQLRFPAELWRRPPDLLFVPSHVVPFGAPAPSVTVVHDLAFERHPAAYRPFERAYLRLTTRWAERRCAHLLTVSEATRQDLVRLHGVDADRVTVVPPGGGGEPLHLSEDEAARRLERLGVRRPFVLHVGRVEPRKNQLTSLAAVRRHAGLQLAVAGSVVDPDMAAALHADPSCALLGRVPDADLAALYEGAAAVSFPSLYEGFGFPVLEAMRRGIPVVAARTSSLPEVGGDAALYVDDPLDADALARALQRALDEREHRAKLGRERAAAFSWERTAAGVAAVLRRYAGAPSPST
jgi:glycosyltransferase involved in cell wall biosynthesis